MDAAKTNSKRAVQKTAEATPDLIGNKILHKITSAGKSKSKKREQNNEMKETLCTHKNGISKNYESIRRHKGYSTNI